ncbi:non-ribosomal peptide synthetase [Mangrovihabitans endophyticus]|uniref:Carrier domain-containing protein n=1 Tax=Mangrovihabitans endophyticus TaxID=1751298 RepID=A0A8J3BWF6_9ACTN|nr:thioester reductase domain-containing protein [Mangrovihabitans endophyticus]GGK76757.1 hypothetical protein GCM10012284_08380 [Mangrovihabitans endophyticus]
MPTFDTDRDLTDTFAAQVRATPDAVALEDEHVTLTYAELDRRTAALADHLRAHGVGRDDLVGVLLGRSADYVIACLAALRAGGAFLVLELAYPPALLAEVMADADPSVVITHAAHTDLIGTGVPLLVLDGPDSAEPPAGPPAAAPASDPERLAFVSYSSGTTGRPKGIANPHRAALRSYLRRFAVSDVRPGDRVACNVFFIWEMLRPLLRGGTVVAVPDEVSYDPAALVDLLAARRVAETLMTPTLLATVLARHPDLGTRLPDLRVLWLNGEVVTGALARRALAALPDARVLNVYSASETHEIAAGDIRALLDDTAEVCPVGPPTDPRHTYVLDPAGRPVEPGVSGELHVGGDCLARGYLNLPETTESAFLPDPFADAPGARMYRTGDRARMRPSGVLEITGRVGSMIKVRGYSVEPGAVETAIMRHLAVRDCAVAAHGDGVDRQLVAYVVRDDRPAAGRTRADIDASGYSPQARRVLSAHLAHYMVPVRWVELDELPLHEASGKTDRSRLPDPPAAQPAGPVSGEERDGSAVTTAAIASLWAAVLNVPPSAVTPETGFFDLGGHSLALADLGGRLSEAFGTTVSPARLAEDPTLTGHRDAVREARDGADPVAHIDLRAALRADAALDEEVRPPRPGRMRPLGDARTVLLTGATGFLGAFLLDALLEGTVARIACLIRPDADAVDARSSATAKLRARLVELGVWRDTLLDRIEVLPGDLGQPLLGLAPDMFDELAGRVDAVVHAGASVNLVYPYAALRNVNVGGTREVLRLACRAGGAAVHHVSTNGVLPPSADRWSEDAELDAEAVPDALPDGYGQSKWVAEQLVHEAGRRGLPVRVYRPGTLSGHSTSGETNTRDLLGALIVESLYLGHAPDVDGWYAEMTPVDYVSRAIWTLAGDDRTDQRVFHLGDPHPLPAGAVFDRLAELGYPTRRIGWDDWVALWNEQRGNVTAHTDTAEVLRGGMPSADVLRSVAVLDDAATQPSLSRYALRRPEIDSGLLATYARHYHARGWLPHPPRNGPDDEPAPRRDETSLRGRVVVVTGASSGIGAAVAAALTREGAHVALAARRADALETVRDTLDHRDGSRSMIRPTDVTDPAQVDALLRATSEELGPVDVLVNCAGVMYYTLMANARTQEWDRTVDVNCKGLLHCLAATVPGMVERGRGHVVAISSDAGRKVFPGLGVYSASKFFVEATLQSLRLETAGKGLRVTSVQPGNTATDLLGMSTDAEALAAYGEPTGARVLDPEDVAAAVLNALRQPEHVAVNEVLIEPREEPI